MKVIYRAGALLCAALMHASATAGGMIDYAHWSADPTRTGPQLPPAGRSLFDHLVTETKGDRKIYRVPFPFSALIERVQRELGQTEFGGGTRIAMIPMGRSLQRTAAAPDFFKYPRIVFAVTGEPAGTEQKPGLLLKDRLYIGYVENTNMLEVISYNEAAGRYEFQLVKDYRAGAEPKVFYANRAICIACHQNHAPIFSKAVWSETNANSRIAEFLALARDDFYKLPAQANLDFPDDIGQSSVRANTLVTQQALWRRGCDIEQDVERTRRCRAAALVAVMQQALAGEAAFGSSDAAAESGALNYQHDFVASFGAAWRQRWPQGFNIAQAELPDRSPLGGSGNYGSSGPPLQVSDFIAAAHVSAALDPLNPRAPRETWRFAGALDASRVIQGWTKFFAATDYRALDAQLLRRARAAGVASTQHQAACTFAPNPHSPYQLKIECTAATGSASVFELRGQLAPNGNGLVDWFNLGAAGQLREAQLEASDAQREGEHYVLRGALKRKGLTGRVAHARSIAQLRLRWPAHAGADLHTTTQAQLDITVIDDFALLRGAVEQLLREQPALFDNATLQRGALLRVLYAKLGLNATDWCCAEDAALPPAALETIEAPAAAARDGAMSDALQALNHNCATCHLSAEHFPPNFLAGSSERVEANLRHCAPRMWVRLNAWQQPPEQRIKTPMPPPAFLAALDTAPAHFAASEEFQALRRYLESLLKSANQPTQIDELLKQGYESLPSCLAEPAPAATRAAQ